MAGAKDAAGVAAEAEAHAGPFKSQDKGAAIAKAFAKVLCFDSSLCRLHSVRNQHVSDPYTSACCKGASLHVALFIRCL